MRTFVTEPLVLALFSELLLPSYPVRYLIPYSSLQELYLFGDERLSDDEEEQNVPLLIEDPSIQQRIIDYDVSVQVYDVADFEFALEEDLSGGKPVVEAVSSSYLPALILGKSFPLSFCLSLNNHVSF